MKRASFPLDLSALAYPMMQSKRTQSNFRFSARLIEPVDPLILEQSLSEVIPFYPNLETRIAPSFFWHKFVKNDAPLLVKEDSRPPLTPLRKEDTNGYPFRLAYQGDKIILEVFHAATDGDIGALFFSDILTRYAEIRENREKSDLNRNLVLSDAFRLNAKKKSLFDISLGAYNGTSVHALGKKGNYLPYPTLLSCEIAIPELKAAAKGWGATVTEYVAACYIRAILEKRTAPLKKSICLFVPVNLRRFFPSNTLQNFVCFERIVLKKGESDFSFERILSLVHEEFATKITKESMQAHVDDINRCFTLPWVKGIPLFIKKPCFKFVKWLMDKVRQTAILSNIGSLPLPEKTAAFVKDVKFFLNVGKNTPLNVAVVSYNGVCHIDITCGLKESTLPERFFRILQTQGKK